MIKKKIAFSSNYCGAKTGFGGFMREIMSYLYKTGKYELSLFAAGMTWEHGDFARWPWATYGTLPMDRAQLDALNRDPNSAREANYGGLLIDQFLTTVRPDVLFMSEDPWAFQGWSSKPWWGKIPCIVHTTLDSLPIYKPALELAKKTPHFFTWAEFAAKAMNAEGAEHVKTLRGTVNSDVFRKLPEEKRAELRARHNISSDTFCFGMLSRNQLRKSFPNILRSYVLFKKRNPDVKAKVLFYTHYGEGWNIPDLCKEMGVDKSDVLATYKCRRTGQYFILPFSGQDLDNPVTGDKKSLITVNSADGLTEEQVNEWYNVLDVYAHAFTSGGQERPIQEAKLAGLVTLVTNYSCGEDSCEEGAGSIPLAYDEYREPGTQFIKATTQPQSICDGLELFRAMSPEAREALAEAGRQWVLNKFSIEVIGKQIEELLDSLPNSEYDFNFANTQQFPDAEVEELGDNREWIKQLYKKILSRDITDEDEGLAYWMQELAKGATRDSIVNYFRGVARQGESKQRNQNPLGLGTEPPQRRVLICMPESLGDILYASCLLKDARALYKDKVIYFSTKPEFREVTNHLEGVLFDKWLPWQQVFDNSVALEGGMGQTKHFEVVLNPHILTQRFMNYTHNASDKSELNLKR